MPFNSLEQLRAAFSFDADVLRWRGPGGRFVTETAMKRAITTFVTRSQKEVAHLAGEMARGEITVADWQARTASQLKNIHVASAAAATGGFDRLTQADYGRLGAKLRFQYGKLSRFARQAAKGELSAAQIVARAKLYVSAGNGTYENTRREAARAVYTEERRVLGAAEHCPDCLAAGALGWQPIGTLPKIGDSVCFVNCKCTFRFRGKKAAKAEEKAAKPKETPAVKGPQTPAESPKSVAKERFKDSIEIDHEDDLANHPTESRHVADLSRVPQELADRLRAAGVKVRVTEKSVGQILTYLAGETPRGWDAAHTWDTVAGAYDPDTKTAIAGNVGEHGSASVALHELGHGVGSELGYNNDPRLIDHHARLFPDLSPYLQQNGPGGLAGRKELFAEGFATYLRFGADGAAIRYDQSFADYLRSIINP